MALTGTNDGEEEDDARIIGGNVCEAQTPVQVEEKSKMEAFPSSGRSLQIQNNKYANSVLLDFKLYEPYYEKKHCWKHL